MRIPIDDSDLNGELWSGKFGDCGSLEPSLLPSSKPFSPPLLVPSATPSMTQTESSAVPSVAPQTSSQAPTSFPFTIPSSVPSAEPNQTVPPAAGIECNSSDRGKLFISLKTDSNGSGTSVEVFRRRNGAFTGSVYSRDDFANNREYDLKRCFIAENQCFKAVGRNIGSGDFHTYWNGK